MNRLFKTLRNIVERPQPVGGDALPGFDNRVEVLYKYAESAAAYEDDLDKNLTMIDDQLEMLRLHMEKALDAGKDRDALEYIRLAARLRPQQDLLNQEIRTFHAVAGDLVLRVTTLMDHLDEAHAYAQSNELSPAATDYLDSALTNLTRYFVMLERVARHRRSNLPNRLAEQMLLVLDDRQLDLELATYILNRRRAIGSGDHDQ